MNVRTILFPIDFSSVASNALDFAAQVARQLGANLLLLHANNQPYSAPARSSDNIPIESVNNTLINEKLNSVLGDVQLRYGISCHTHIEEGRPEQIIPEVAEKSQVDLIIMGTQGFVENEKLPTDSLTTRVMEKTNLPLLVIPQDARYDSLSHWLYAFENLDKEKIVMEKVFRLAASLKARVELLHVKTNRQDGDEGNLALSKINGQLPDVSAGYKVISGDNVLEGLSHYIDESQPDLLVMSRHDRSFVDRVFKRDIVKTAANQINFPLLVLHG